MNGVTIRSCVTAVRSIGDASVTTIEAIGTTYAGRKVQRDWLDLGYCQFGVETC